MAQRCNNIRSKRFVLEQSNLFLFFAFSLLNVNKPYQAVVRRHLNMCAIFQACLQCCKVLINFRFSSFFSRPFYAEPKIFYFFPSLDRKKNCDIFLFDASHFIVHVCVCVV